VETIAADSLPEFAQTGRDPVLVEQYRVNLQQGVTAVYPLAGEIETPVRIEVIVLDGTPDPLLQIRNTNGDLLAASNTNAAGEPEVIGQFQFPGTGFYELGIQTDAGSGVVGVSVYELDSADIEDSGVFASTAQTLHGTIEHPSTYHTFRLPLERGQRVDLYAVAETEGLDLLFNMYNPAGLLVAARDDNLLTDPYLWGFMPNQSGIYTVVLSNFDENTGDYTLTVEPSEGAGEATIGTRADATLEAAPRRSTWFTVDGRALEGISVEVRPVDSGIDITLDIYDPYGNRIAWANDNGPNAGEVITVAQFPFDGQYQVALNTLGEGGAVDYLIRRVRQVDISGGGRLVPSRFKHEGEFDGPNSFITYVFDGSIEDLVGMNATDVPPFSIDLAFTLYDPEGYFVLTRDDVVGFDPVIDRYELQKQGRYAVILRNVDGGTGEFEFYLTDPRAPDPRAP
jgi:hypothetical protein